MSSQRNGALNRQSLGNPITEQRTDSIGINGLVDPSDSVVHKKERSVHSPIGEEALRGSPPTPLQLPPTAIGSPSSSTRFRHPSTSGSPPPSIWSDLPNPIGLPALPGPASRAQQLQPGARLSPPVIDGFNRASPPWEGRAMAAPPSKAVAPPGLKPSPPRTWSETAKPHTTASPSGVLPPGKGKGASGRAIQPSRLAAEPPPTAPSIWEQPPPQRRGSISSQEPIARPVPPLPTSSILAFMQLHSDPPVAPPTAAHNSINSHMHTLLGPSGKISDEFHKSLIPRSVPLSQTQTTSKPPAPLRLPVPHEDRDAYESEGDSTSITSDVSPQISPFTSPRTGDDGELPGIFGMEMDDREHESHVESTPSGEHPYGEFPSPTLFVRNINSNVEDDELRALFEPYGPIRTMYTQCKHRGFVMISYFEIRHAQSAMQALQGRVVRRRKLDIHYSIPKSYGSAHSSPSPSSRSPSTFHRSSSMQRTPSGPWSSTSAVNPAALQTSSSAPLGGFAMGVRNEHHISTFSPPPPQPALQHQPPPSAAVARLPFSASEPLAPRPDAGASSALNASQRPSSPESVTSPDSPMLPSSASGSTAKAAAGRHHRPIGSEDKSKYDMDLDRIRTGEDTRLTLMIKNIPNKYNQKMLLAAVDERHKGTYDFFYLPIDFKNKCNVGYAFINFVRPISIVAFYLEFNNRKWEKFNSEKVCTISYARIQGKSALIQHFQNSSLMSEDKKCRPIIFHSEGPNQGEQEPFPVGPNIRTRRTVGSKTSKSAGRKSGKDEKPSPDPVQSPSSL